MLFPQYRENTPSPPPQKPDTITDEQIYSGFGLLSRNLLINWRDLIVTMQDEPETANAIDRLNERLKTGDAIIFFDHHYAFDALPASLVLAKTLRNVQRALIPYAVFLEMGIDTRGEFSWLHKMRTEAFLWFINNIRKNNPSIHLQPLARTFELDTPGIRQVFDEKFTNSNIQYIKLFNEMFSDPKPGNVCVLAPMAGLAFPEKALLHAELFRLIKKIQKKRGQELPIFMVSTYPRLVMTYQYIAPLLNHHTFVARGPFELPAGSYEEALEEVKVQISALREAGDFLAPDYDIIREHSK